jgi:3',5'-cyclic AMP phosphodiesterase CpdA
VLSDLHLSATVDDHVPASARRMIEAVIRERPRFVVITGDFTNGEPHESRGQVKFKAHAWRSITALLEPLREAGIPVLPTPGNHDTYLKGHREHYEEWADLEQWAAPLPVTRATGTSSYSVDLDGVHLALPEVVDQVLSEATEAWLERDLEGAREARLRLVFGHVPLSSVMATPNRAFVTQLGTVLAEGDADLYVAGHEHLVWDENVRLPDSSWLRQILVGTATGFYDFGPSGAAKARAGCKRAGKRFRCTMPNGGTPFELRRNYFGRWIQAQRATFTLLTVDGTSVTARVLAVDKQGRTAAFGLAPPAAETR